MLARTSDPDTSHDAAAIAALSPSSREIKGAILRLLRSDGPATAFELRDLYFANRANEGWPDCQPNTINRRASDLANIGLIVDTGQRRKSPDNRDAIVWRATTRTERKLLLRNYGMAEFDVEVETDWSKVSDVRRLRQRIAELEAQLRESGRMGT